MSVLLSPGLQAPAPDRAATSDRAQKFLDRVDRELPAMTAIERRKFLDNLIDGWERRYQRFIATDGKSEFYANPRNPVTAADFTMTIVGLAARRPEGDEM